jgi:hypothetical protein
MIYRTSIVLLIALALLVATLPPTSAAQVEVNSNAAIEYWNGFAALPVLDEQQQKIVAQWNTVPLDDNARSIIEASKASLTALQRGAQAPNCNWGLHYEQGPEMLMPHLAKARDLGRLAGLRARCEFEQGNYQAGVDDVTAALVLARRAGADVPLICLLVEYAMELPLTELTANYLTKMDAATLKRLASSLATLPPGGSLQKSVLGEKQWIISWLSRELKDENKANWKDTFRKLATPDDKEGQAAIQAALQSAGPLDSKWRARLLGDLGAHYDDLLRLGNLPEDQFMAQFPVLHQKLKTSNPVAALVVPMLTKVYKRDLQARTRMALFQNAVGAALEAAERKE